MSLKSEAIKRFQIICNSSNSAEKRIFAALELICSPLSFVTIFVFLPALITVERLHVLDDQPTLAFWLDTVLRVLLSASVGYLTNFIAIEMLFKPFKPSPWHLLSIMTFGYWRQGMVPKSKDQIGEEIGKQVEEKLLDSRQISQELCDAGIEFLKNPQLITTAREKVPNLLREHETAICGFLIPEIERTLGESLRKLLTRENMQSFWEKVVEPRLNAPENRRFIAEKVAQALKTRAPEIMEMLREMVREYVRDFLSRMPLISNLKLEDGFISFVNWKNVQAVIEKKLSSPETIDKIGGELVGLGSELRNWFLNPNAGSAVENFREEMQEYLRAFLKNYLQESFPKWLKQIEDSPELWSWIQNGLMPSAQVELERWIQENGQALIQEKLHISQRVQKAVEKQDVKEFYQMISNVAAQHLGAIQVLGFILGGIVGLVELLL